MHSDSLATIKKYSRPVDDIVYLVKEKQSDTPDFWAFKQNIVV